MLWERHPGFSVFISFSDKCHTIVMQLYVKILTNIDFRSIYQQKNCGIQANFKSTFIFAQHTHTKLMSQISFDDFLKVDIRVGTIVEVQPFPQARKPAWQLLVDFGPELGLKRSSAQLTTLYTSEDLIGKQVLAVVNFPPRQIANFFSEVLVLGLEQEYGSGVVLLQPERKVANGIKMS